MRRLAERLRKSTKATLVRLRSGATGLGFVTGLVAITASAFTVSVTLGLFIGGFLLAAGSVLWERGGK